MTFYLKTLMLTLVSTALFAATESVESIDGEPVFIENQQETLKADWIEVEVIVFTHKTESSFNQSLFTEQFKDDQTFYFPNNIIQLNPINTSTPLLEFPKDRSPFITLPQGQLQLNNTASKINSNNNYELYYHTGWWQPILPKEQASSIMIESGSRFGYNYELIGAIEISKDRFVQIDLNLGVIAYQSDDLLKPTFTININPANSANDSNNNPYFSQFLPELTPYTPIQSIALTEFRQIEKERILQYFDHPKIGAIVKLTLLKWPQEPDLEKEDLLLTQPTINDTESPAQEPQTEESLIKRYAVPDEQGNVFIKTQEEILAQPDGIDIIKAIEAREQKEKERKNIPIAP